MSKPITQFGRSLEFSGGLFSNLSIEMPERKKLFETSVAGYADKFDNSEAEAPKLVQLVRTLD